MREQKNVVYNKKLSGVMRECVCVGEVIGTWGNEAGAGAHHEINVHLVIPPHEAIHPRPVHIRHLS